MKPKYKLSNWASYNRSPIQRVNLTVWIDTDALKSWKNIKRGTRGRPFAHPDEMILLFMQLKLLFHFPLRQTQSFLLWLREQIQAPELVVPSYSQVCRRAKKLEVPPNAKLKEEEPVHLVVDATGLKIYGDGEWSARQHDYGERQVWKKLHICMDDPSFQIVHSDLTAIGADENRENSDPSQ